MKFPLHYYGNNTVAVQVLLSEMRKSEIKSLVFSSSCSVYGSVNSLKPATENISLNPVSPYGRSKLFAERIIQDEVSANNLKAVALRYFNVAGNANGVGHDISQFNLLPNLYRAISKKMSLWFLVEISQLKMVVASEIMSMSPCLQKRT
jgi:UDP-glucose 4-epimerase